MGIECWPSRDKNMRISEGSEENMETETIPKQRCGVTAVDCSYVEYLSL